jgi:hypothetical protein
MTYPVHPNKEPPFPETSPCFVCGLEKGHDLTKHVDPSLGRPIRICKTCGWRTVSTSTLDACIKCGDDDGLRPKHFLTRDQCSTSPKADR